MITEIISISLIGVCLLLLGFMALPPLPVTFGDEEMHRRHLQIRRNDIKLLFKLFFIYLIVFVGGHVLYNYL
jgi:hypothetical protein